MNRYVKAALLIGVLVFIALMTDVPRIWTKAAILKAL